MSKVKVLIEHEDGHKQELNGDTVICFTVSKAGEFFGREGAAYRRAGSIYRQRNPRPDLPGYNREPRRFHD